MNYKDGLKAEVLKRILEGVGHPVGASATANGHYPVDDQEFQGELPDEEPNMHDDDPNAEEDALDTANLLLGKKLEEKEKAAVKLKDKPEKMEPRKFPRLVPTEDWGKPDNSSREEIYKFFKSVGGKSMKQKLEYINGVVDGKVQAKVKRILVTLVFLDSLSQVVKSFGSSSAGFVFEAFLAALLHGTQLTDRTASGGLDLADIMGFQKKGRDGQLKKGVPISLKLLVGGGKGKAGTGIHGSYANLVAAMARENFPEMVYIVALKDKSEQADKIDFWQFPIWGGNFISVMSHSSTNDETIRLHKDILQDNIFQAAVLPTVANPERMKFDKNGFLSAADSYELIDSPGWQSLAGDSSSFFHLLKYSKGYLANFPSPIKAAAEEKSDEEKEEEEQQLQESIQKLMEASKDTQFLVTQAAMRDTNKVGAEHIGAVGVSDADIKSVVDRYADQLNDYLATAYNNLANLSNDITSYFLAPNYKERVSHAKGAISHSGDAEAEGVEMKKRAKDDELEDN